MNNKRKMKKKKKDRVSQNICLDWPRTMILLISASQVARITGISHHALLVPAL
jgi:hypothetical protein